MTALAARRMGVRVAVLDPDPHCPASAAAEVMVADHRDEHALGEFGSRVDAVTFDHEGVPVAAIARLERAGVTVAPGSAAALMAIDKAAARRRFAELGLPVPRFVVARDPDAILAFGDDAGWPVVAKAASGGYDGRGVRVVERDDVTDAWAALGPGPVVEERVPFEAEVSVLVARRRDGSTAVYPPVATMQHDGMCVEVSWPAPLPPALATAATGLAAEVAQAIGVVGVLAVEMFVVDGRLLVNEVATRPHNTGHLTIEAFTTSQFEQHLRAVLDLPLGSVEPLRPAAAMINVVGSPDGCDPLDRLAEALAVAGASVHLYGKPPRPGRKLGHVTALAGTVPEALSVARAAANRLNGVAAEQGARS